MFGIEPRTPNAYYMPGADPGDGYMATNDQLYGSVHAPASWPIVTGTVEGDIMGCFTPAALPVLSALATGFAVCDQWFASVPAETLPNRAFTCAATSQGTWTTRRTHSPRRRSSDADRTRRGRPGVRWCAYPHHARTDDVLAGVTVPVAPGSAPAAETVSHLESIHAELIGRRLPAGLSPDTRPA